MDSVLPSSFAPFVLMFSDCFTGPTFRTFQVLLSGWILCLGRHTVTGVLVASGAVGQKHHTSFHRFFRTAAWSVEAVGLKLLELVLQLVDEDSALIVAVDDTLGRHTGKHIRAASMHHDPLLSTRTKAVFHWGHVWVVVAVVVRVPKWNKTFALPVLVRLYRSEKLCRRNGRPFLKKTELAAQMIVTLTEALPARRILVVGDAAFVNASVIRKLPPNVDFIGRARMDAALYARPVQRRMGRPRVKGRRLPSPEARARSIGGWRKQEMEVNGHKVTLYLKVFEALWYVVGRERLFRFVLVRGWPGHEHDDVLCSTDLTKSPETIIREYCLRWSLEVTFHETKGKLGFEEPQNRTDKAVERTAPMALFVYTLTVAWYILAGHATPGAKLASTPWYQKTLPAFSDMLAALRRETWRNRLLDPLRTDRRHQKSIASLLQAVAYGG